LSSFFKFLWPALEPSRTPQTRTKAWRITVDAGEKEYTEIMHHSCGPLQVGSPSMVAFWDVTGLTEPSAVAPDAKGNFSEKSREAKDSQKTPAVARQPQ
jgi:hypothetical protein